MDLLRLRIGEMETSNGFTGIAIHSTKEGQSTLRDPRVIFGGGMVRWC